MMPFRALRMHNPSSGVPSGTFLVGANNAPTTNTGLSGDFQLGSGFLAGLSGTANNLVIMGGSGGANPSLVYRLCIYAASSATVWSGSLLGKTADITGLGLSEVKSIPLLVPVPIVSGQWYALTIQCSSAASGSTASGSTGANDRFFSDAFSDGPLATAGASGLNATAGRIIYATT